jgi:hypothetical protein
MVQWLPYAGFATRLDSGLTLDLGSGYSGFSGASNGNALHYLESHAGISFDDFSARLNYSPDYFHSGERTLYAQVDGSSALAERVRLMVHLGGLQVLSHASAHGRTRRQFDIRTGVAVRCAAVTVQLSWVAVNKIASVYPVDYYEQGARSRRSTWVLQATSFF